MKLKAESIAWAVNHLFKESDNDLFPRPFELSIIKEMKSQVIGLCQKIDIEKYRWNASRRFVVPKDELSFRNATQLDLIDSILVAAIIYEYGNNIEEKRIQRAENVVFSYRFKPLPDGTLYENTKAWNNFFEASRKFVEQYSHVALCDISDFYNQINLHTIENQMGVCGFPKEIKKAIHDLLVSITQRSSKGIPIGPHVSHLIAEMSLIPFDDHMHFRKIPFKRYVDDIFIFCNSYKEAKVKLNQIAEVLDKEQRIGLQRGKTRILTAGEFIDYCNRALLDDTIVDEEDEILRIINEHTDGNGYTKVKMTDLDKEDLQFLNNIDIEGLFNKYLKADNPGFERIRWWYRRLAQLGLPIAVDFSITNFEKLIPALNDVCLYLNSCAENYGSDWKEVGEQLIKLLDDEIIRSNEFYQISLLNLFVYNANLNHINGLIDRFDRATGTVKRKILLASQHYNNSAWLRVLKERYPTFDDWTKRAYLIASKSFTREEKKFFYKSVSLSLIDEHILERIIMDWSKKS